MSRTFAFALVAVFPAMASTGLAGSISDMASGSAVLAATAGGAADSTSLLMGQVDAPDGQPMKITVGGGLQFCGVFSQQNNYDVFAGMGFFGIALVNRDLAPGRTFPVPAVGLAEIEFLYAPGRNSIADFLYTARVGFGINLLHFRPGMMFFPYAAVGFGFETLTGRLDVAFGSRSVAETRFVLPFEVGAGFSTEIKPGTSLFARAGFCFPINAANISGCFRAQFGVAVTL